jgi:diadenosine tetraphosphate (Ap4A) HIT family hydrolase
MECQLCALVERLDSESKLVKLNEFWTINEFQGDLQRPRYVLQVIAHKCSLTELSIEESVHLTHALSQSIRLLESQEKVERVYVESYNETLPGHLHIHLTPRFHGEELVGPELTDKNIPHWDWWKVWSELVAVPTHGTSDHG